MKGGGRVLQERYFQLAVIQDSDKTLNRIRSRV
jgi:hypothetical protein